MIIEAMLKARSDKAILESEDKGKVYVSNFQANLSTFNTGGSLISTSQTKKPNSTTYPSSLGFDHMQSFIIGFTAKPTPNLNANVQFNVLGNIAENPIDEIFMKIEVEPLLQQRLPEHSKSTLIIECNYIKQV